MRSIWSARQRKSKACRTRFRPRLPEPPKEEPKIAPEPEPAKEEPTPEPPKEEPEPKPEPPKEEPKVAKVEEPKPVPKPEPKKEPEPLKKEPPKEAPPKKEPAKPQPTQIAKNFDAVEPSSLPQSTQTPKKIGPPKTGAAISNALPSALDGWSRLVQRKVERYWEVPGGVRVGPDGDEAVIAFWVDRQGSVNRTARDHQRGPGPDSGEVGHGRAALGQSFATVPGGFFRARAIGNVFI